MQPPDIDAIAEELPRVWPAAWESTCTHHLADEPTELGEGEHPRYVRPESYELSFKASLTPRIVARIQLCFEDNEVDGWLCVEDTRRRVGLHQQVVGACEWNLRMLGQLHTSYETWRELVRSLDSGSDSIDWRSTALELQANRERTSHQLAKANDELRFVRSVLNQADAVRLEELHEIQAQVTELEAVLLRANEFVEKCRVVSKADQKEVIRLREIEFSLTAELTLAKQALADERLAEGALREKLDSAMEEMHPDVRALYDDE